jgi:metal transporter CNNM
MSPLTWLGKLGELIQRFRIRPGASEDIVEEDVILLWNDRPRVVTGTDILGRLLRGIARPVPPPPVPSGLSGVGK